MLSVQDALATVVENVEPFPVSRVPLHEALGLALAEDAVAEIDSPPFDKSMMDGFAVRAADLPDGRATLRVVETITAGHVPARTVNAGEAARIMTGAPIPEGADAVVKVEQTQFDDADQSVRIDAGGVSAGDNVIRRGTNTRVGDVVLPAGRRLRPQEVGTLAELGRAEVAVRRKPTVAILATGDELVPVEETPGPGQIRNTNEPMLAAQVLRAGGEPLRLGIARDDRAVLRERIQRGLDADVLILSGGVSAGTMDLVPSELEAAGVREVFHGVQLKPGKPLFFGVREGDGRGCLVFGLPGNPVSSMVCLELFVRTALRRLMGVEPAEPDRHRARLTSEHTHRGGRPVYFPARIGWAADGGSVQLTNWHGSSDLRATVEANGVAVFPGEAKTYAAGSDVDVILWD